MRCEPKREITIPQSLARESRGKASSQGIYGEPKIRLFASIVTILAFYVCYTPQTNVTLVRS